MKPSKYFQILFEDDDLFVLNKNPGISAIPDRAKNSTSLLQELQKRGGEVLPVHRIDRDTSGIILFAKNQESQKLISEQFLNRTLKKVYQAIIEGRPFEDNFTINAPIFKSPNNQIMKILPKGKESITHVQIVDHTNGFSLAQIILETGRTHQIRVHMAHVAHPIIGDMWYHPNPHKFLSKIKKKFNQTQEQEERPIIGRTALHAQSIEFTHPTTNECMEFKAEWPKDLKACWNLLKKYDS